MFRKCLMIVFVLVTLISCTSVETLVPEPSIIPVSTSEPLPTEHSTVVANIPKSGTTIVGVVMDVSLSARIIMLKEPVEGFSVIALAENCELRSSNGEEIELHDIQSGVTIQASGHPGESDALLTDSILVLETKSMNGDVDNPSVDFFPVLGNNIIKNIILDPTETPNSSFENKQGKDYQSGWVKMSDPHYGIRFAVPCFWHVDMSGENYRGLSYIIRNYSYEYSARFPGNDKDFWESGGIKIDVAFPEKAHRGESIEDYVTHLHVHAEADDFEVVSTEDITVNGQEASLVTTKSVFGVGNFYLFDLNENTFLVFSLSLGAIENPDVQAILHSIAIDSDTHVVIPDIPPGYPLEEVIRECMGANELEAKLVGPKAVVWGSGKPVKVHFALINNTKDAIHVLNWYTPFEEIAGDIFRVTWNGQPLPYLGILEKRGNPSPESYILIGPGNVVFVEVNLSEFYDFSRPGIYTIAYKTPCYSDIARSEKEFATTINDLEPVIIPSNEVKVEIVRED